MCSETGRFWMKNYVDSIGKMGWNIDEGGRRIRVHDKLGENVAGGLGFESFFHRSKRWGLRISVGESFFFDVVDFLRGGVCKRLVQVILSCYFEWRSNLHNDHTSLALELVLACKSHSTPKSWVQSVGCHPFRVPKDFLTADQQSFLLMMFFLEGFGSDLHRCMIFLENFVRVIRQLRMSYLPWCMIDLCEHLVA